MKDYITAKERLNLKDNDLIKFIKHDLILFSIAALLYVILILQFLGDRI